MSENKCPITGMPCFHQKQVHVTDLNPDYTVAKAYDLCQVCGNGKQKDAAITKNFLQLLTAIFSPKSAAPEIQPPPAPPKKTPVKNPCPNCGSTLQDIGNSSKVGCGNCYHHFRNELLPVLMRVHQAMDHVGKKPKRKLTPEEEVVLLQAEMKQAIELEQYEKAQEIKEKLKNLLP